MNGRSSLAPKLVRVSLSARKEGDCLGLSRESLRDGYFIAFRV